MKNHITILNGSNLNLLGQREPEIYGSTTLGAIEDSCHDFAKTVGIELTFLQTNHEGVLVDLIQESYEASDALIINPAGYSFTSVPILDALKMFEGPVIELHISNIHARDEIYHHSLMSSVATAVICGLGVYGYIVAMQSSLRLLDALPDSLPEAIRVGPV